MNSLTVLYEDNHLLVIDKAAGVATMGAESGLTAYQLAVEYLREKYHKPGRVYLGVVSRLDTMTSGALVFARTSKAAARLSKQFAERDQNVQKIYLAAVAGHLDTADGQLEDFVWKDDEAHRMRTSDQASAGAKLAQLRYTTVAKSAGLTIVAVQLQTGRKHQIRLQFADRGHAILGDRKYGSKESFPKGIGLHSYRLSLMHPTKQQPVHFQAELPKSWCHCLQGMPSKQALAEQINCAFELNRDPDA